MSGLAAGDLVIRAGAGAGAEPEVGEVVRVIDAARVRVVWGNDRARPDSRLRAVTEPAAGLRFYGTVEISGPDPARARDVEVRNFYRAECCRPGCGWRGAECQSYREANAERVEHLGEHMAAEG